MNNISDLISIVVPVYNVEEYIEECIISLVNQTYNNIEIIMIDDGSIDDSGKICDKLSLKDGRIKVIHQENMGVSVARNTGINIAKGKYILFVDSDDYASKDMVCELYSAIDGCDMSICGIIMKNDYKLIKKNMYQQDNKLENYEYLQIGLDKYLTIMSMNMTDPFFGAPYNKLFRLSSIVSNDIRYEEKESFAEDFMFNLKYLQYTNKIGIVNKSKYYYRRPLQGGLSRKKYDYSYMCNRWRVLYCEWLKLINKNKLYTLEKAGAKKACDFVLDSMMGTIRVGKQYDLMIIFMKNGLNYDKAKVDNFLMNDKNKQINYRGYILYKNIYYVLYYSVRRMYRFVQRIVYMVRN